jgi:hypothetical protein
MQPLDYETPQRKKRGSWLFWPAFASAYYLGIICIGALDDARKIRATGYPGDGGMAVFSLLAFPFFVGIGLAVKIIWRQFNSLFFALTFPILAPLIVYLSMWLFGIIRN